MGEWDASGDSDSVAKPKRDTKVSFMVPEDLIERVRALAKERRYPMAAMLRDGLRLILDREAKK